VADSTTVLGAAVIGLNTAVFQKKFD